MNALHQPIYQNRLAIFNFNISIRFLNLILWPLATALLVTYLATTTQAGVLGYQLKILERQVLSAQNDQKNLGAVALEGQALDKIATSAQALGFIPVSKVDYINSGFGEMARR